ncbi:hypothetical protein MN116_007537, partial [Schistosoma mekongi]
PLPPINIHVYWKTQYVLTVEWTLPTDYTSLAYLIIHYATHTKPNLWHKYFVKDLKTTEDLSNLDPNEEYLIRLSSVDINGNEGESSEIVSIHSYKQSLLTDSSSNNNNMNMNNRKHSNFIFMNRPDEPEKFTVQNFQCIKRTMKTVMIEWLPPIHLANLLEYELYISGRNEFITSSGLLKSVHLGDIQLHHSVNQQIDNNELQMFNWRLTDMIDNIPQLDNHHQHHQRQQLTHKMLIPNLKPNSQYKITIRPIYRALITEGTEGTKEGIPVTILCHTEWSAPEYIRPPELLAIYSGPPDPHGPTSIIEVKLYRVSEENGPLHNYYVIVSPELNTITLNQNTINNNLPMKSTNSYNIDASQYDLISLSQNNSLPSNQAPYLALARYTMNLFEPNHEISIVILGSEEIDNFTLRNQYYLNPIVSRNQTFDRNTMKYNDNKNDSSLNNKINEYNTYYSNHYSNMFTKVIQVNNKRLFQSTVYRVALRACSQYPNGQQLCSTSQWSDKISPINPIKSNIISSKLKSYKEKIISWNLHESSPLPSSSSSSSSSPTSSSSLPIILISLTSLHRMPIPIEQFHEVIYQLRSSNYNNLKQEFSTIEQITTKKYLSTIHSNLDVNKVKNRYANILAYDCTRVLIQWDHPHHHHRHHHHHHQSEHSLEQYEISSGLDYINANYIDGYRKQKAYIATQAPLPNTFNSFWTMIWEQNTSVIVMLTKIIECGEMKCDQYWPNHGMLTFADITVTHIETNELANYVMRSFEIRKDNENRKIWHLQYTSWPDQDVPTYSTVFLMFLRRVGTITPNDCGPIVVHCSSGTGRTGVYIAISILLERMKTESVIDIFGLVNQLHMQRNYMIETQEQYQFIYTALYESITDGNTEVSARNLYTHLQHLSMIQTIHTTNDYIGQLNNHLLTSLSTTSANNSVNLSKNRLVSIVPFDWNRVILCSIRGVNGSDYINASLIDGYLKKNAYIACQGPMISTVEDFWRMVWEKHSCLIVMLCSVKESGKEKCFTYWPEDKPLRYQFFVVDLTAQYTMSSYILREFKVTDTRDGESRTIRQLQYIRWNEQGLPQTSDSLIDLIGYVHKTKEQYNYDGPITVHCSSGSGRTGLFITMCNVLERLRQESVVDMYQTVKLLRQQRVWMIQTEEQYRFCYTTTLDYLNSFDLCTQPQLLIQTTNNLHMNSPNLNIKMKSSHYLSDKTVLYELDRNYELRNNVLLK